MVRVLSRALLALLSCICAAALREGMLVTPVQKVLELMHELLATSTKDKQDEEVKFAAFGQWCKNQHRIKTNEIEEDKEKIEHFKVKIEKASVLIKKTDARIKELEEDVGRWNRDEKSASSVRRKEKEDFTATVKDYQESLEALDQAIETLKKQDFKRPQAELLQETLLQVRSRHRSAPAMPEELARTLAALTQESSSSSDADSLASSSDASLAESTKDSASSTSEEEDAGKQPGAAAGYEFQSGGVLELMGQLKDKFRTEKTDLEKEELNAQHAYEQVMQQLADNIEGAEAELSQKKVLLTKTQEDKADNEGNLAETTKELDEDEAYLKDAKEMCMVKTNDFKSRQKLRQDEIDALKQAIEIIGSEKVAGAAEKNLPQFVQLSASHTGSTLAHLRSDLRTPSTGKIAVFLAQRARSLGSALLMDVAQRAEADPFKKVQKMIQNLIVKLMEEQTAEIEHKGWCDTELTTNKQTRDKKSEEIEQLSYDIEDLENTIGKLTQENAELTGSVKDLDDAMIKATEERQTAKATNQKTLKEAKGAVTAVEQAIAVLKDYYAKAGEATALAQLSQSPEDDAPETFDSPFKGNQEEGGGIVGMLEVILSDFTRLDSETTTSEAQQEDEYKNYMFESQKDRKLKANQIDHNDEKKSEKESALQQAKEDLKVTEESLDKANKYYEKLKPDCVDTGISYEERKKKREEEIQSLQEALKVLQSE